MGKRIPGKSVIALDGTSAGPASGLDGVDMTLFAGRMKPQWWLITLDVQFLTDDFSLWGAKAVDETPANDVWGLHQDEFATFPLGAIGTLPTGRYQFMVDGLGLYSRVAVTTGGATQKASLDLGTLGNGKLNTVVRAQATGLAGESLTVTLIGDAALGAGTIDDGPTDIILHYKIGVSTVADMETLIGTSTLIEIATGGTAVTILDAGTAFAATPLAGGGTHVDFTLTEILDSGRGS